MIEIEILRLIPLSTLVFGMRRIDASRVAQILHSFADMKDFNREFCVSTKTIVQRIKFQNFFTFSLFTTFYPLEAFVVCEPPLP